LSGHLSVIVVVYISVLEPSKTLLQKFPRYLFVSVRVASRQHLNARHVDLHSGYAPSHLDNCVARRLFTLLWLLPCRWLWWWWWSWSWWCQYAWTVTENEGVDSFVLPALCHSDAIKVMQRSNAAAAAAAKTGFGRRAAGNKRDVLIRR